jgi:cell envelope-related Asp23 family protein
VRKTGICYRRFRSRTTPEGGRFAAAVWPADSSATCTIGVMETPVISTEVLARYAGDAAQVTREAETADVVVHLELEWGAASESVAREVQERVAEYLARMAHLEVRSVDVVVERVGSPPARQ